MTRRNPPTTLAPLTAPFPADIRDQLWAALDRYSATFPGHELPFLYGVQPADQPMVAALLDLAVAMGQPLPREGIMHILGYLELPPEAALTAGADRSG